MLKSILLTWSLYGATNIALQFKLYTPSDSAAKVIDWDIEMRIFSESKKHGFVHTKKECKKKFKMFVRM